MKIKALSLIQPWALLLFAPAPFTKTYETRSWYTSFRGKLAIHASGQVSYAKANADVIARQFPFSRALERLGYADPYALPFGAIVGVVDLVDCIGTSGTKGMELVSKLSSVDLAFGDFSGGRFMWRCANPRRFKQPIPARGSLNLWDCEIPEGWE